MMNPTFQFVEDYIEFIGGYRTADGKKLGLFQQVPSPISLARYDVAIISSLSSQTAEMNKPLTDKQSQLAIKLVEKYRRQLGNLTPPIILPEKLDKFRLGVRAVDRTKSVFIEDNQFILKFPYDTKLIDMVKKQAKVGEGSMSFDSDRKVWKLGMTEHMLNWIMAVCPANDFLIDESVSSLYQKMLAVEEQDYNICLTVKDNNVLITNAPSSLLEFIEKYGGLHYNNLLNLIDASSVLGYSVDKLLLEQLENLDYGSNRDFVINKKTVCSKDAVSLDTILNYAKKVNRLPIHVYDIGLPKNNTNDIVYLNRGVSSNITPKLLVSFTSMMIGSKKQSWVSNAEKIIIIE